MPKQYLKFTWVDEVLSGTELYSVLSSSGGALGSPLASPVEIQLQTSITQSGSPVNSSHMNNIEVGVDTLDNIQADQYATLTSGSSTAYTLTTLAKLPTSTGEHFRLIFHTGAGSTPTLNRDGNGAKNLKYYDTTGTKQSATATQIVANQITEVVYDGTDDVIIDQLPSVGGSGGAVVNELFNPGFDLLERQLTPSTLTAYANAAYHFDRWYLLTDGGATDIQVAQVTGDTNSQNACQLKQTNASAKHMGIAQVFGAKKSKWFRGQTLHFQIRGLSSSTPNIKVAVLEWTGTADSPTKNVVNNWASTNYTAGNFFLASNVTVSAVAAGVAASASYADFQVSATISSSCNNLIVMVWTEGAVAQNVTVNLANAGLFVASSLQTWEAPDTSIELSRCRYYGKRILRSDNTIICALGWRVGAADITFVIPYEEMRTNPTLVTSSPGWATANPTGNNIAAYNYATPAFTTITGALTFQLDANQTQSGLELLAGTSFSGSSGNPCDLRIGPSVTFFLDAELGV